MNDSTKVFGCGVAVATGVVTSLILWKYFSGSRATSSQPKDDVAPRVQNSAESTANASDAMCDTEHADPVRADRAGDPQAEEGREEVQEKHSSALLKAAGEPPVTVKGKCMGCEDTGKFRCSRCRKALFCSQECQRKVWKSHKLTCNVKVAKTRKSTIVCPPKDMVSHTAKEEQSEINAEATRLLDFETRMAEAGTLVQNGQLVEAKCALQKLYDENAPSSLERGNAARVLAATMACLFECPEHVAPLLTEALRLAHKYNDFLLTFDTLTVMAGEEKRRYGPERASHLYEQALELCERRLGNLGWKQQAQALGNKAGCLAAMGPQHRLAARELMNKASALYEMHIDDLDSSSCQSWIHLNCNNASLIAQTHPELAVEKYQETLKLFKIFPSPRNEGVFCGDWRTPAASTLIT